MGTVQLGSVVHLASDSEDRRRTRLLTEVPSIKIFQKDADFSSLSGGNNMIPSNQLNQLEEKLVAAQETLTDKQESLQKTLTDKQESLEKKVDLFMAMQMTIQMT